MSQKPRILVNHLTFTIPESLVQFKELTLSFAQHRYGIVGDNGIGKTTLLRLIAQLISPQQGSIQNTGTLIYCPQNYLPHHPQETVAETLGIAAQIQALTRIQQANPMLNDYDVIGNKWDIEIRAKQLLADFDLTAITWDRVLSSLSHGQQTKCLLIKAMLADTDFILWDEPTNNLDSVTRAKFYTWLQQSKQGLLIVSHDRLLLDQMDEMIEITTKGVQHYGGNYSFYQIQKTINQQALQKQLLAAKQQVQQSKHSIQQTRERHEQRRKKGKALQKQGKTDKLTANATKGRSEKTQMRNAKQAVQMLEQTEKTLAEIKSRIEIKEQIHANLATTRVANSKTVIKIDSLYFAYPGQTPLFKNFNFSIIGPERVALSGKNGSGKTTLIKLLLGDLQPLTGDIYRGVQAICYLDQYVNFLDPSLSLIANFQRLNPAVNTRDAYFALASFNFRNKDADKKAEYLSGGERIRAGLAINLLAKAPPQLIILDEPTNHLDIQSIEAIESALNTYQGALLVVSHDQRFLEHIGIHREVTL